MKFFFILRPFFKAITHRSGILIPLLFAFLPALPAYAWGPVGHETVAYIAADNLTPAAKKKLAGILAQGDDLASISNWADKVRMFGRPETAPWHFIDLPIRKALTLKDEQDYCPNNDCVLNQLQIFEGILGDESQPKSKRLEALKFVVHFMGDLHQPLHCADDGDRGGNDKEVRFKAPGHRGHGAKIKLHALWDHLIELKTEEDPRELATELEKGITEEDKKEWTIGPESTMDKINKISGGYPLVDTAFVKMKSLKESEGYSVTFNTPEVIITKNPISEEDRVKGTKSADSLLKSAQPNRPARLEASQEADWAFESYQIAKKMIYPGMDPGPQDYTDNPLPSDYFDKMRPIVDQQLEKAGIRLAYVLNEILK